MILQNLEPLYLVIGSWPVFRKCCSTACPFGRGAAGALLWACVYGIHITCSDRATGLQLNAGKPYPGFVQHRACGWSQLEPSPEKRKAWIMVTVTAQIFCLPWNHRSGLCWKLQIRGPRRPLGRVDSPRPGQEGKKAQNQAMRAGRKARRKEAKKDVASREGREQGSRFAYVPS